MAINACWKSQWRWCRIRALLLLDEPTQGLSVEETAHAVETLAALLGHGNMTVLLKAQVAGVERYLEDFYAAGGQLQRVLDRLGEQRAYRNRASLAPPP